jgi:hypothetical protein
LLFEVGQGVAITVGARAGVASDGWLGVHFIGIKAFVSESVHAELVLSHACGGECGHQDNDHRGNDARDSLVVVRMTHVIMVMIVLVEGVVTGVLVF